MEPEGLLQYSWEPVTLHYPEPVKYSQHPHILFKIHFNIILLYGYISRYSN
jgi:hypothetical protein